VVLWEAIPFLLASSRHYSAFDRREEASTHRSGYAVSEPSRTPDRPAILGGVPVRPEGPPEWPLDDPAVHEALNHCAAEGAWGKYHGPYCDRLVDALKEMHGCEHARLCSSGTAAVELVLRGLKVGPGDEVVLAAYDFKGNFANVVALGATPVLVDIRPDNWQFDTDQLQSALSEKTKAILVTHLHGGIVDMPRVMEIARRGNLQVIEDACQMPGARVHGHVAGRWGDVSVLSFGGSKLLTAGRGGAILTHEPELLQRIKLYSHRGNEAYPLSELQAAVLLPQVVGLDVRNRKRVENVAVLCELLGEDSGLTMLRNPGGNPKSETRNPKEAPSTKSEIQKLTHGGDLDIGASDLESPSDFGFRHSDLSEPGYYKLGFQYDPAAFAGLSRDDFACAMRAEGIALDPGFRALHLIHAKRRFRAVGKLPVATDADARVLTLHHPVLLEDAAAMRQIADAVAKIRTFAEDLSSARPS
jgi:dTDP-4-amino-4,6-dideoxygalactose transaminase